MVEEMLAQEERFDHRLELVVIVSEDLGKMADDGLIRVVVDKLLI